MVVREDQLLAAGAMILRTRVRTYRAVLVDVRWAQAIHSCSALGTGGSGGGEGCTLKQHCQAVHYGLCSAVKFTPLQQSGRQVNGPRGGGRAVRIVTKVNMVSTVNILMTN